MVCAQAFHWFASSASLGELARVLKPGGRQTLRFPYRTPACHCVRSEEALARG